jgi:alkanesulfonate monooxygenase
VTAARWSEAATAPQSPRQGDRPPSVGCLAQIASAAEDSGFTGALTPTGAWCEDAWLTTAMVSQHTTRLKFLVAFRPGFISPTLAGQMASTPTRANHG